MDQGIIERLKDNDESLINFELKYKTVDWYI